MKMIIDTTRLVERGEDDALGALLCMLVEADGGHPHSGRADDVPGWTRVAETPRHLAVLLMGDGIYEGLSAPSHVRHDESGLEMLWYADGDLSLMFHKQAVWNDPGFILVNSHNGRGSHWRFEDLAEAMADPRVDPEHVPNWG
jgi:hypothetical protein